jgi:hypothetical protein
MKKWFVGILHPGAMGVSLGATIRNNRNTVLRGPVPAAPGGVDSQDVAGFEL